MNDRSLREEAARTEVRLRWSVMKDRAPLPGELKALVEADMVVFRATMRTRDRLRLLMMVGYFVVFMACFYVAYFHCTPKVGLALLCVGAWLAILPALAIKRTKTWKDTER